MKKLIFVIALFPLSLAAQNPLLIPPTLSGPTIDLDLQYGSMNFYPGQATETMGANGNILGPTLVLNRNETVTINVTNNLTDSTTIHWHGMHVSPENDGGPHIVIPPGQTWSPEIPVLDWAATYWYHPHLHMHTNDHVLKGIAGLVIVKDDIEGALVLPRTYGIDDIPLVIQTKEFDANNQISLIDNALDTALMVNATLDPFVAVPAQVVRFRVLNGSSMRTYNLGLSNGQTFYQIGSDGGLLEAPVSMTRLKLSPGERAEILVDFAGMTGQHVQLMGYAATLTDFPAGTYGSPQPGMGAGQTIPNYTLNPLNNTNFQIIDFEVIAQTAAPVTTIPATLVAHTPWQEADADPSQAKTLTFSPVNMGPTAIQGPFLINMMAFDMMMINYYIPFESTEIWTLSNETPISHPFHIHDVQFYVLDINGAAPPLNQRGRKDVILVPGGMGTVRFITKFEDFHNDTLPYMYHCHMLVHEDTGMMGQFIVNSPLGVNEMSLSKEAVYPNPLNETFVIKGSGSGQTVEIVDMQGKVIYQTTITEEEQPVNIGHLNAGAYFLNTVQDDQKLHFKLVKN
jgi:bilirubin oxidase